MAHYDMDSLYYNTPKPFNKFPTGYRPMSGNGNLRPFGSLSSLSHHPPLDSPPATAAASHMSQHASPHHSRSFHNSFAVLPDVNSNYHTQPSSMNQRSGSVGPYTELPYIDVFSPPDSPMRTFSPEVRENRALLSPTAPRPFEYGGPAPGNGSRSIPVTYAQPQQPPPPQPAYEQQFRSDDFLEKLRRQKEEIERAFPRATPARDQYGDDRGLNGNGIASFGAPQTHQQRNDIWNGATISPPVQEIYQPPSYLHKTQSDSSLMQDLPIQRNHRIRQTPAPPPSMSRSYSVHPQDRDDFRFGSKVTQIAPKDGFFGSRLGDPNWMTDPPPPINFPLPQSRFSDDASLRGPGYFSDIPLTRNSYAPPPENKRNSILQEPMRNSYHEDRDNFPRTIPIRLDEDRILKIHESPPLNNNNDYMTRSVNSNMTVPLSVQTLSPPVGYQHQSHSVPNQYTQDREDFRRPPIRREEDYPNNNIRDPMETQFVQWIAPNNQVVAAPPPPPSPPPPPIQQQQQPPKHRLQRVQSMVETSHPARFGEREPLSFPETPQDFREELMSTIPLRQRPSPFINRQSSVQPTSYRDSYRDEELFSPVESQVYPGMSNRINGFANGPSSSTSMISGRSRTPVAGPSDRSPRERSFAVVSRPQTPPATLERRAGDFSPPVQIVRPNDYSKRTFSPPSSLTINMPIITDNSIINNRSMTSPMSSYDNDSDSDMRMNSMKQQQHFFPPPQPHRQQRVFSPPPHGILVKDHGAPRAAKKVVFRCDQDTMDRIRRGGYVVSSAAAEAPAHVRAFDDAVEDALNRWYGLSDKIGGDVAAVKNHVSNVFDLLRSFLWTAAGRAEPSQDELQKMVAPIVDVIGKIEAMKSKALRNDPHLNHLSAVSEGIPAVGWILVKKTEPHVRDFLEAGMFYVNRILKDFKEGDQTHVEWAKGWKEILEAMRVFVKQVHTTGVVWNSAPGSAPSTSAPSAAARPAGPPAGGPPPPPPPPPPAMLTASTGDSDGRGALLAELNRGADITKGLKKVTADMQTHKNPGLRAGQGQPLSAGSPQSRSPAHQAATPVNRPPKIEFAEGKQWNIEYQVNNRNIVIDIKDKKHTVYVYKCEGSMIKVNGKCNSVVLDNCKKTSICFDGLVAQCETINCQSIQIQTLGDMPTISIQKTDGCQVYLSEASKNSEIVSSKSSEMNILVPNEDGEFAEFAVPEQFKTVYSGGKLVTQASDII